MPLVRVPLLSVSRVTTGALAATVRVRVAVALCGVAAASLTLTWKEDAPLAVGVPLMAPVVERAKPLGKVPEATLQL